MKMFMKKGQSAPPGEVVCRFGYTGRADEDGRIVLDVPDEFVKVELAAGRLLVAEGQEETRTTNGEAGRQESPGDEGTAPDLNAMTVVQLRDFAKQNNISLPAAVNTKPEIIAHLTAALSNKE
jgi:hypothetical protein